MSEVSLSLFLFSHLPDLGRLRILAIGHSEESQDMGTSVLEKCKHNLIPTQTKLLENAKKELGWKLDLNTSSAPYSHGHLGQAT